MKDWSEIYTYLQTDLTLVVEELISIHEMSHHKRTLKAYCFLFISMFLHPFLKSKNKVIFLILGLLDHTHVF